MNNLAKFCSNLINWSFYALFFLTPLVLTPWNYELFEFNKMLFVYGLTVVITASWLIKIINQKQTKIKLGPIGLPLLIFLASQLISAFFSIQLHTSIWGYYSRFNGGLVSLICYTLLYLALVNNFDRKTSYKGVKMLIYGGLLVAGYGILERFGVDKNFWIQDVQNRVFSTLGQPNWLAAYLTILIPISLTFFTSEVPMSYFLHPIPYTLFYICLLFTKSRSGFLAFGITYLVFWLLLLIQKQFKLKKFFTISLITLALSLFIGTPFSRELKTPMFKNSNVQNDNSQPESSVPVEPPLLISDSGDIRKIVWQGGVKVWQHWPIFGSGPETFAYSYYNFRPREHNDLSEWDFLYNKAHNEYLNYLATTGLVGLISYLLFIGWSIFSMVKSADKFPLSSRPTRRDPFLIQKRDFSTVLEMTEDRLRIGILAGWISILITNFFGFSVVVVNLLFFLLPGLAYTLRSRCSTCWQHPVLPKKVGWVKIGGVIIATVMLINDLLNMWQADYLFARGEKLAEVDPLTSYQLLDKAVQMSSTDEALFHAKLAETSAYLASLTHQQIPTQQDKQIKQTLEQNRDFLAQKALDEASLTLELNPVHLNFYKSGVKTFTQLAVINPDYYHQAEQLLQAAVKLAPTDTKLFYNLAIVQQVTGQNKAASESFEKTIDLKPNYTKARTAYAEFLYQTGQNQSAITQLEYILEKINPYDETAQSLLDSWHK